METLGDYAPTLVRKLAREWLCADAIQRGAWNQAVELACAPGPKSRATRLVGAASARIAGDASAPGRLWLNLLWLFAPRRRATRPLVDMAESVVDVGPRRSEPTGPDLARSERSDSLEVALRRHVKVMRRRSAVTPGELDALGHAWDRALEDPNTRDGTLYRAGILGSCSAAHALDELARQARIELASMIRTTGIALTALPRSSVTLAGAAEDVRDDLLRNIDLAFRALEQRVDLVRALPAIDEWREFSSLRRLHGEAARVGGLELRRLAFPDVHNRVCKLAVWLWNERAERAIAHAMFQWLLDEATAVGDEMAIDLQRSNLAV
jgi:hypothetical protein